MVWREEFGKSVANWRLIFEFYNVIMIRELKMKDTRSTKWVVISDFWLVRKISTRPHMCNTAWSAEFCLEFIIFVIIYSFFLIHLEKYNSYICNFYVRSPFACILCKTKTMTDTPVPQCSKITTIGLHDNI